MKKFLALILALVMMTALSVPAFAANYALDALGDQTITVTGKYNLGEAGTVYSVEITWNDLVFDYTANATWDDVNHETVEADQYGSEASQWRGSGTITVVNNSNVVISAESVFDGYEADGNDDIRNDISGTITGGAAANIPVGESRSATLTITGGALAKDVDGVDIGTITVTIAGELQ